jgi:hypothetical protein
MYFSYEYLFIIRSTLFAKRILPRCKAKYDYSRMTASFPYFWPITNCLNGDRTTRLQLVDEVWSRMPAKFTSGEQVFSNIFVVFDASP